MSTQKRKVVTVLTCALLLVLVALFAVYSSHRQKADNVFGTYSTNANQPEDGEYYVLQSDGNYMKYRQFQILEQGSCRSDAYEGAHIITLSQDVNEKQILHTNSQLYEFNADGTIAVYSKISEQSVYINVDGY